MPDLSAADIAALRDLLGAIHPDLFPLAVDQARSDFWTRYFVADANGLEFATVRNDDDVTAELIVRAINALPALVDAAEKVAELTDMCRQWEAAYERQKYSHREHRAQIRSRVFALENQLARVSAIHTPTQGHNPECGCGIPPHSDRSCTECRTSWPCPTIRALTPEESSDAQ